MPRSFIQRTFLLKFPCAILLMHQTSKMALVVSKGGQYHQGEDFSIFFAVRQQIINMSRTSNILLVMSCAIAVTATILITMHPTKTSALLENIQAAGTPPPLPPIIPKFTDPFSSQGIVRRIQLKTQIQEEVSYDVTEYTVERGDSLWSIGQKFNLKPETILWGNEWLSRAGVLQVGDILNILPVDGVLHTVQDGDTLETLQTLHGTPIQEIFEYIGNEFDLTQPAKLVAGEQIIVPGGTSPIFWSEAQPPSAQTQSTYKGNYPNLGTGYFVWPLAPSYTLTQEYWGGHPAIDIDTYLRQPIFASDTGTVAFSGWDDTGYGNLVIIDHGNGYRTYYGHNEALLVSAGQVVYQGQQIAESGSTGNSSAEHLDFRILIGGMFVNPLDYLP